MPALLLCAAAAAAQTLPLDDKARYENALEEKVEEVLLQLLGPNQAKVVVQASMDFTRTEKVDVAAAEGQSADKSTAFKWQSVSSGGGQPFNEYLLPGFPMVGGESESRSYTKQFVFPASFIKKINVTVVLNKTLSEEAAQNVRSVVSDVLALDARRGDQLSVIRAPFAPVWRTVWYTPEAMGQLFKYIILSLIGIISMIIVAVGFLKLAAAMNTMAKAQQSHQITMDLGKGIGPGGAPPAAGSEKIEMSIPNRPEEALQEGGGAEGEVVFNVRPEQVDFLVTLMVGEEPANIALVAGHLPEAVKSGFLGKLPPDVSAEVISNLARVRFVDPDVILTIREELEKRLAGAFGGIGKVLEAIAGVGLRGKKDMLASLERSHPEIAREVRPRIFLPEDLMKFSDRDFSILATSIKIEEWAFALWELPQELRDRLKGQLTGSAWAMLEQTMKYGSPSRQRTERAVEAVVASALALIREGRVLNPLEVRMSPTAVIEAGGTAAPPVPGGEAA